MLGTPFGFQPVDVPLDLSGPGAEPCSERHQLDQFAGGRVQGESVVSQCLPEVGVGGDGGVTDAVDGVEVVTGSDRVQAAPLPLSEHPGVDLQVEVPVGIPGPGRVVPDDRSLNLLNRNLHLTAPWADPGRRVLGDPADDLLGRPVLRAFLTYAMWANGLEGGVGGPDYARDTEGWSWGVQMESWW